MGWENRSDAGPKEARIDSVLGASVLLMGEGAGKFTLSGMRSDRECENNGETGGVRPRGGAKAFLYPEKSQESRQWEEGLEGS